MKPFRSASLLVQEDNGSLVFPGVTGECDATAEHEGGQRTITNLMGRRGDEIGIERFMPDPVSIGWFRRQIVIGETTVKTWETGKKRKIGDGLRLCFGGYPSVPKETVVWRENDMLSGEMGFDGISFTAWGEDAKDALSDLHDAALDGDVAWLHVDFEVNPFSRGSMMLVRPSLLPVEILQAIEDGHLEHRRLREAADQTGIKDKIDARVKESTSYNSEWRYHALRPRWTSTFGERANTTHEVMFFLNPGSPKMKAGWYSVEDLEAWLDMKGPVVQEDFRVSETQQPSI